MNKTPLLLALVAVLCGIGVWFAFFLGDDAPPPANVDPTASTAATPAGNPAAGSTATDTTEASATTTDDATRDAVTSREALAPIPEDATWIEVKIVDKATGEALPGATVTWHDDTIERPLREDPRHLSVDRYSIWHDPEELGSRFGWQTTSNARGIARIHQTASTEAAARHGSLYGHAELGSRLVPPSGGFRIELEPDRGFAVQVLDAGGQPAVGVPVAIAMHDTNGVFQRLLNWDASATTRAPDGIAPIRHVQDWPLSRQASAVPLIWRARIYLPGLEDEGVEFDIDELPPHPLVLRLPPCGIVRVRTDVPGQPTNVIRCFLAEHAPTSRRLRPNSWQAVAGDDGWATFEHVPLGKEFVAHAPIHGNRVSSTFAGPMSQGAVIDVVLSPATGDIVLSGRLVSGDRSPMAAQPFELRVRGKRLRRNSDLVTDGDGRFLALIGSPRNDNQVDSITVLVQRDGERPLIATAAARELRPGTEDLGDLVLQLDALVVAGRCEIDGRPAKLPGNPSIEREQIREGREPRWEGVDDVRPFAADDGTFEFRGTPEPGRFRLALRAREHMPIEPIDFALGRTDLIVRLESGTALAATMLVPEAMSNELSAELTPVDPGNVTPMSTAEKQRLRARIWGRPDGRQQADWSGLLPGLYDLTITLGGVPEPLHTIAGITAPPPPTGDPRLVDIDLRERLQIQTIRLFDETGAPVTRVSGACFPMGQDPAGDLVGFACHGTETKIPLPRGTTSLLIGVSGYRPTEVQCTGEPLDVRLDPWPTVTLTFENVPELPDKCTLQASLEVPDPSPRRWRAWWLSGRVSELHAPPMRRKPVANGRVELPVGDAAQKILLHLQQNRRSVAVEIPEQRARIATPNVTVRVPEDAWQKALRELAKEKE